MKKLLLSAIVVGAFIFYILSQKTDKNSTLTLGPKMSPNLQPTSQPNLSYKNGTYTGNVTDAFYGNVQVQAVITGNKISDVIFLQYPNDRRQSVEINSQATPLLRQEAISNQTASVDIISGATQTSRAFRESLASALNQAQ